MADRPNIPSTLCRVFLEINCADCNENMGVLYKDLWIPDVILSHPNFVLDLADIDIRRLGNVGIIFVPVCSAIAYNYSAQRVEVRLMPLRVTERLDEESLALFVSMFRQAGWKIVNERNIVDSATKHYTCVKS